MTLLKADFHIHTSEDPRDYIRYSALELIDMAHDLGYQVLSITNHDKCTYSSYLRDYAKERGIILLPGMEATIEKKHVLLINFPFEDLSISTLKDLYKLSNERGLIIAPHPFYPSPVALGRKFIEHLKVFDAVEWSHFYSKRINNFNLKMERIAKKANIPIVGTSDAHQRIQFHTTYTLVDSEFDEMAVIEAVKTGRVEIITNPMPFASLLKINIKMLVRNLFVKNLYRPKIKGPINHSLKKEMINRA